MQTRRNIELKFRLPDLELARQTARQLATATLPEESQRDTFFRASHGRLKLRQRGEQESQLIWYDRADGVTARPSDYYLVPVSDAALLRSALEAAWGIEMEVVKRREIYLYHNVRIHLDQVQGLGSFLEFEAVVSNWADESRQYQQLEWLIAQFRLLDNSRVAVSYADLLRASPENPAG